MKSFIKLLLFVGLAFSQHFVVEVEDTGSSTLFVFESSIFSLDEGDELGIFDDIPQIEPRENYSKNIQTEKSHLFEKTFYFLNSYI